MKRTFLGLIFILAAFGVYAQNSGAGQGSGVISELTGTVELKNPGTSAFVAAKAGDTVSQDTVISTGFKSTALVEVGSAVINVRPLTRLTLTEIAAAAGTETLNVNLQAGRVRVDVNPPAGTRAAMTVSSPVATASVRGTSFDFDTRNLQVNHGTVAFAGNRGQTMRVSGGSASSVESDGRTADPVRNRSGRLRPPTPVGSDPSSSASGSAPANSGGMLVININYYNIQDDSPLPMK